MKKYKVKDLMVPLSEYAVISEEANIYDAVVALEEAQQAFDRQKYYHRAILVADKNNKIVGKLSQLDVLKALEPKYEELQSGTPGMAKYGFSKKFLISMLETYNMFDKPLDDICKKAGMQNVSKYMHQPTEGEFIDENDSMDLAIHMLVVGHHQSLLVTRKDDIVGILRLTDIFAFVFHSMKECGFNNE